MPFDSTISIGDVAVHDVRSPAEGWCPVPYWLTIAPLCSGVIDPGCIGFGSVSSTSAPTVGVASNGSASLIPVYSSSAVHMNSDPATVIVGVDVPVFGAYQVRMPTGRAPPVLVCWA